MSMRPPDPAFAEPAQADLYDVLDPDRSDLDAYAALVAELGASRVVDVGCGTGCLAVRLAAGGMRVIGVDPAGASLAVARTKPHADLVRWIEGDATALSALSDPVDLVVMTGNVAQVFVADEDWSRTLAAIARILRPGGRLAFETRRPQARAWERWDIAGETRRLPDGRDARVSRTVTRIALPLVTFSTTITIGDQTLRSDSTLRFRERHELRDDLARHGFTVDEVRDAPDRPGLEWVFLTRRTAAAVAPGQSPSSGG